MIATKRSNLEKFRAGIHGELFGHILPFWCGPALDHEHGGWMPWLSNDLKPDHTQPQGLILNTRLLWTFSAVHRAYPSELIRKMADRAFDIVMNRFWDAKHGGAFWRLDQRGNVVDDSKKIYGQAFYIYAVSEYYRAFESPAALARAQELFELIEQHAHEARFGGYIEVCNRDWSEAERARLSEKDMDSKKSMNTHLHVLEAYTNLCYAWKNSRVKYRLRELIRMFEQHILNPFTSHQNHFFDDAWRSQSDSYTYGHDIESSWLLCECAEVLGDEILSRSVGEIALRMADAVLKEGLDSDGGLCYEGRNGSVIDAGKEWWPQAEALVGFINAFELSDDSKYLAAAQRIWNFVEQQIADRTHGEWFWRIAEDGKPDLKLPKVSEWKDPYHGVRACLESLQRLQILSGG